MTTQITFEVGTLADAIRKAAIVAPSRAGNTFDKAAGIVLDVTPDDDIKCTIRATNIDVYYLEVIDCVSALGEATRWRLPSTLLSEVLKSIKPTPGRNVTITKKPNENTVLIQSDRLKATARLIDPEYYPEFEIFDIPFGVASNVASRIEQVSWATAKQGSEPLTGIHFNGTHVMATDRYRVACAPLAFPIDEPLTVPASLLASILRQTGDVTVGATDHMLVIKPDDYTQIACTKFAMPYPNLSKIMSVNFDDEIKVKKVEIIDLIGTAMSAAGGDRDPIIQLIIGKGEVAAFLRGHEGGVGNIFEIPGQASHGRVSIYFAPQYLTDAIGKAPTDTVTLKYRQETETKIPLAIDGGAGYKAWVAPRSSGNSL